MEEKRQEFITDLKTVVTAYQRAVDAFDEAVADRFGLNRSDLRCLDVLFGGAMSAGHLAEAAALSPAAMTTLIDRMEKKGYVRRVRDTADRRRVLVEMTERAKERAWRTYGPLVEEGDTLLSCYTAEQLALISNFLRDSRELTDRHRKRLQDQPFDTE